MEQSVRTSIIRKIRTTKHAEERMKECNMSYGKLVFCLLHAEPVKPIHSSAYKKERYNGNKDIYYMQFETYVFTCLNKVNKNGEITLVITVTDQRVTLKTCPPGEGSW